MKAPSYYTDESWARHVDRSVSAIPDIVNNLEVANRVSDIQSQYFDEQTSNLSYISDKFNDLNYVMDDLNSFSERSNKIEMQHNELLELLHDVSLEQLRLQELIEENGCKQTEILEKQLEVQSEQLNLQQYQIELQRMQLEQSQLQTQLQQSIAIELSYQTNLLETKHQTDLAREKVSTLKEYFNFEIQRLNEDSFLPEIVKYLLAEKYIVYIKDNDSLKDALSFLEVPFEFTFGSIIAKLKNLKMRLVESIGEKSINNVLLNLKLSNLYDNIEEAKNRLAGIEKLQQELLLHMLKLAEKKKRLDMSKENRVENPSQYVSFWQWITRGIFNKEIRNKYSQYRKKEAAYTQAQKEFTGAQNVSDKLRKKIQVMKDDLVAKGFPADSEEFGKFCDFLSKSNAEFISNFPYFQAIRSAHQPFLE